MTVEELIDHLTQYPPDALVTYCLHSEVTDLRPEQVTFVKASDKKLCKHPNMPEWYMQHWYAEQVMPEDATWVTAVVLPGN